jgi:hypothetical protein
MFAHSSEMARVDVMNLQYWPKVTHTMKRASYNAFATRMSRMKRASSVQHTRDICAGFTQHSLHDAFVTRLLRLCRPFMYYWCLALLARIGSARDHGLLLVSTVIPMTEDISPRKKQKLTDQCKYKWRRASSDSTCNPHKLLQAGCGMCSD